MRRPAERVFRRVSVVMVIWRKITMEFKCVYLMGAIAPVQVPLRKKGAWKCKS